MVGHSTPLREWEIERSSIYHSIVICTASRYEELVTTLRDLQQAVYYPDISEIVVVNNGNREATTVIKDKLKSLYQDSKMRWTVVHEELPGLSNARNTGLTVAAGEIVTFLDDDASPKNVTWQKSIFTVFRLYPEVGMCGGPSELVVPVGYEQNPWWRSSYTDELFSCQNQLKSGLCEPDRIYGLNVSYRSTCLEKHKFNPKLGWDNARKYPFSGEETLLNKQIYQSGWDAWYEAGSVVRHRIDPQRYNVKWVLRRCFIRGRSDGLLASMNQETSITLYEALRNVFVCGLKMIGRMLQFRFDRGFSQLCRIYDNLGLVSFYLEGKCRYPSDSARTSA